MKTPFVGTGNLKAIALLPATALALLGPVCLTKPVHAQTASTPDAAENIYIAPSITGHARQVMTDAMRTLDREDRANVIYVDQSGTVYANRPELIKTLYRAPVFGDSYLDSDGRIRPLHRLQPRPPDAEPDELNEDAAGSPLVVTPPITSGGTGPFRRVYSKATSTTGFAWESAQIYLPGGESIAVFDTDKEDAEVYEGGWGSVAGAVDAGFQFSDFNNWWSAVALLQVPASAQYPKGQLPFSLLSPHFTTDEDVNLKFYCPSDNVVAFAWSAVPYPTGTITQRTVMFAENSSYGWHLNGKGCILKRMTSIAQATENLSDGSYARGVHWHGSLIGASSSVNRAWASGDVGGYQSYPMNSPKVSIMYVGPTEETDSIDLGL